MSLEIISAKIQTAQSIRDMVADMQEDSAKQAGWSPVFSWEKERYNNYAEILAKVVNKIETLMVNAVVPPEVHDPENEPTPEDNRIYIYDENGNFTYIINEESKQD